MKHIKLWEGWIDKIFKKDKHSSDFMDNLSKDEILFTRISDSEAGEFGRMKLAYKGSNLQREDFTIEEINEIKKFKYILIKNILKDYRLKVSSRCAEDTWAIEDNKTILIKSEGGVVSFPHQFKIHKYQDEWYNVFYTYVMNSESSPRSSSVEFKNNYYKCDTFEGVIQCLKFLGLE